MFGLPLLPEWRVVSGAPQPLKALAILSLHRLVPVVDRARAAHIWALVSSGCGLSERAVAAITEWLREAWRELLGRLVFSRTVSDLLFKSLWPCFVVGDMSVVSARVFSLELSIFLQSLKCFVNCAVSRKLLRKLSDDRSVNLKSAQSQHQLRLDNAEFAVALPVSLVHDHLKPLNLVIKRFPFLLK